MTISSQGNGTQIRIFVALFGLIVFVFYLFFSGDGYPSHFTALYSQLGNTMIVFLLFGGYAWLRYVGKLARRVDNQATLSIEGDELVKTTHYFNKEERIPLKAVLKPATKKNRPSVADLHISYAQGYDRQALEEVMQDIDSTVTQAMSDQHVTAQ